MIEIINNVNKIYLLVADCRRASCHGMILYCNRMPFGVITVFLPVDVFGRAGFWFDKATVRFVQIAC